MILLVIMISLGFLLLLLCGLVLSALVFWVGCWLVCRLKKHCAARLPVIRLTMLAALSAFLLPFSALLLLRHLLPGSLAWVAVDDAETVSWGLRSLLLLVLCLLLLVLVYKRADLKVDLKKSGELLRDYSHGFWICCTAHPASQEVYSTFHRIAAGKAGTIRLLLCDTISAPFSTWFFGPVIVMPSRLVDRRARKRDKLRLALAHEFWHVRNNDPVWDHVVNLSVLIFDHWLCFVHRPMLQQLRDELDRCKEKPADAFAINYLVALGRSKNRIIKSYLALLGEAALSPAPGSGIAGSTDCILVERMKELKEHLDQEALPEPPANDPTSWESFRYHLLIATGLATLVFLLFFPAISFDGGSDLRGGGHPHVAMLEARLVQCLENVGGKAKVKSIALDAAGETRMDLDWWWPLGSRHMVIQVLYQASTGNFLMWRQDDDSSQRPIDPTEPAYWPVPGLHGKVVYGRDEIAAMHDALAQAFR